MVFGIRYFAELRSKYRELFWRVEIGEREWSGEAEEMSFDGNAPLTVTWERRGDEFFAPVKASEVTVNILCTDNFRYLNLFTADPRKYRVSVFRNTKLYWRGYVTADLYSESFAAPPYTVSVRATDGFNLLSNVPFVNVDGSRIEGRKTLWQLLSMCLDVLELDLTVTDWMELYAEGMSETTSPLKQAYVDMERLYYSNEKLTYRDVLELCLAPFGGEIFQGNGTLNIRRVVSLYNTARPTGFYSIGRTLPVEWLLTEESRLTALDGTLISITKVNRGKVESIWQKELTVNGTATLDIVPALRGVTVQVRNKLLQNLVQYMAIYDLTKWNDPYGFLSLKNETTLRFTGNTARKNDIITHAGCQISRCSYRMIIEFTLRASYSRWSSIGGSYRSEGDYTVTVEYGFKVVGTSTYWLQEDGLWIGSEATIVDKVNISSPVNRKIETEGIPITGILVFFIKQRMAGTRSAYAVAEDICEFADMSITIDTDGDYEDSLKYETILNRANNVNMEITLPASDIPNIPNDKLIYALYFTLADGNPTRIWHSRGGNDYGSLTSHLAATALRFRQLPSRRITGELFTGRHIDLNTILKDDRYLNAGFYINALELNALDDRFDVELVEMPGLLHKDTPPQGDDCIMVASLGFTVISAVRCENQIILLGNNSRLYRFDSASGEVVELCTVSPDTALSPADGAFVVADGETVRVIDWRGAMIHTLASTCTAGTYMGSYVYVLERHTTGRDASVYYNLVRPEFKNIPPEYWNRSGYATNMYGDTAKVIKSPSAIAVNTGQRAYLHDRRIHANLTAQALDDGTEIVSMSDWFLCINHPAQFRIYRRDAIGTESMVFIKTITGKATLADHTPGEVAYCQGSTISVWSYRTDTTATVRNNVFKGVQSIVALFYINGELYIVRSKAIFKRII